MAEKSRGSGAKRRYSYSDYRRLSPDENERQGFSRKARHYVLKSVKAGHEAYAIDHGPRS